MSERAQGRIVNVWTTPVSTPLTQDEIATATVLNVEDASVFNDDGDGGWVIVGAEFSNGEYVTGTGQVIAYTDVDDDASTVTLAEGLTTAADEDDPIYVWSDLYGLPDSRQYADVDPDGRGDRADFIECAVDDELELIDGDRGKRGEACTIVRRRGSDEWTVKGVRGRPHRGYGRKWEDDDPHTLTADEVSVGLFVHQLKHAGIVDRSMQVTWGRVQPPSNYTVDLDAGVLTYTLGGNELAADVLDLQYQYVNGPVAVPADPSDVTPLFIGRSERSNGSGGGTISTVPQHASTIEGDLLVLSLCSGDGAGATCTDARMTLVATVAVTGGADYELWLGHATASAADVTTTVTGAWALVTLATFRGADSLLLDWSATDIYPTASTNSTTNLMPAVPEDLSGGLLVYMNRGTTSPENDQIWSHAPSWTPHFEHWNSRFVCSMATSAASPTPAELTLNPGTDVDDYWWAIVVGLELAP